MEVLLVGLMLVLVGAVAAAVPGPVVMAQDIIKTYPNSNFMNEVTHFANGSRVYTEIIDPDATAPNYSVNVFSENNLTNSISFLVYSSSSNNGTYYGNFTIGTNMTNGTDPTNNLYAEDNQTLVISSSLKSDDPTNTLHYIHADYAPPSNFNCTVINYTTKDWLGRGDKFNVTLKGEANGSAWFSYNGTNVYLNRTGTTYTGNYTVNASESHNGTVLCYHADEAGNVNSTNTTERLQVDTAAPVISIVSPVDGGWTNNNRTAILFNVTDAASGVGEVNATANGTALNLSRLGDSYNATNGNAYNDGNVTVFVNTTDGAGNPSNRTWHFMVDTHAPYLVNFTSPVGITYNTSSVNFTFTAYDSLSNEINCSYAWYFAGNNSMAGNRIVGWVWNNTENTTTEPVTPDGRYYADYQCEDRAGNVDSSAIANFTVDTAPPVIYNVTANDTRVNENQTVEITAFVGDGLSPNSTVVFSANGTYSITAATAVGSEPRNYTAYFNASDDRVYNIIVTATDAVGNTNTTSSLNITVDNTPPLITPTLPVNGTVYSDSEITYTSTVNESASCTFHVNNTSYPGGNGTTAPDYFTDGNYTAWFECTDMAGNTDRTADLNVTVADTTPPGNVTGLTATGGSKQVSLSWNAVGGDVANYTIYHSPTSGGPYSLAGVAVTNSYNDNGLADGTRYYYMVAANDINGNQGNNSTEVSAKTDAASTGGSGGGGSGSSGGGGGSSSTVIHYHDDPPMPVEKPIVLPTPVPQPVVREPATEKPSEGGQKTNPSGRKTLQPLGRKTLGPITGLLFKEGSLMYGLAALMALASVWVIWSLSKVRAKRKWYEK